MSDDFISTEDAQPADNKRRNIIIIAVVVVVLCCCCGIGYGLWNFGDTILDTLGIYL